MTKKEQKVLIRGNEIPERERDRLHNWPKVGICLEKVMAEAGHMEDIVRTLREDEKYSQSYTIEEQIQNVSDRLRTSIRAFERVHKVKIEIFTFFSPFEDHTEQFIPYIQKPEEME